ncbi:MFS transporter [Streptosporangium sp. NPDC001559]|uniref:MFS transporter n=1 Tax=Streptosporangium sp. NPDC001559 TaxID=3366187 RepID=UPI0036EF5DF1
MLFTGKDGATYSEVFANGQFRVLFGSFTFLVVGDQVKMLALAALVYARTGSPGLSAMAYMLVFLPYAVGGTFLLSLADRIRPRALMIVGELVRVVTCLLLAFTGMPVWMMLVLVLVTGLFSPVFGAARSALLPDLLPGDTFVLARSVLSMTSAGAQIAGLGLGGGVLAVAGPTGALTATAVLSVLSALVLRAGLADPPARGVRRGGAVAETLRVNRDLLADPGVRGLLLAQWLPTSFLSGAEAMLVPYLGETAGIALAAACVGLAVGNLLMGRFAAPYTRERLAAPLAVLSGVPLLVFALTPGLALSGLALLLATAASGACQLGLQRRFVEAVPERVRGQSFGLAGAGLMTGQAVGAALVGGVSEVVAPSLAVAGAGVAVIVSALVLWRHLRPVPAVAAGAS